MHNLGRFRADDLDPVAELDDPQMHPAGIAQIARDRDPVVAGIASGTAVGERSRRRNQGNEHCVHDQRKRADVPRNGKVHALIESLPGSAEFPHR